MNENNKNIEDAINKDKGWKTIAKEIVDRNDNYDEYEKEVIKFILDMYHEHNKSKIIRNAQQAKLMQKLIEEK